MVTVSVRHRLQIDCYAFAHYLAIMGEVLALLMVAKLVRTCYKMHTTCHKGPECHLQGCWQVVHISVIYIGVLSLVVHTYLWLLGHRLHAFKQ